MKMFNLESVKVQEDKFRIIDTTSRIGKPDRRSVSVSWILIEEPVFYAIPIQTIWLSQVLMLSMGYQHRAKRRRHWCIWRMKLV